MLSRLAVFAVLTFVITGCTDGGPTEPRPTEFYLRVSGQLTGPPEAQFDGMTAKLLYYKPPSDPFWPSSSWNTVGSVTVGADGRFQLEGGPVKANICGATEVRVSGNGFRGVAHQNNCTNQQQSVTVELSRYTPDDGCDLNDPACLCPSCFASVGARPERRPRANA